MSNKIRILTTLFFFSVSISYAQIDDLSLLGINSDSFNQVSGIDTDESDQQQNNDISTEIKTLQERDTYTDDDYGYTGTENFNNPPSSKFPETQLEYFGYSYFTGPSSSFVSLSNIPVTPDYLIGPNDTIKIILYGNKNKRYELEVNRDGNIFIPELGPLTVAGLSFENLKELIGSTVSTQLIGTDVSVTLGSLRTIDIFILGAAKNPSMYSISALSSMTNAIFESGGIDTSGSLRDIKLKRNGKTINALDLYDLLINGDTTNNTRLMQGDVIFIEPVGKTAGIRGEVNRPGIYELKPDEGLSDLLMFSGNLKPKGNKANSEMLRVDQKTNSFNLIKLNLDSDSVKKTEIVNGDIVSVYPINNRIQNAVLLSGHTSQQGFYPWEEGMKITDILRSSDDLLEMTDLNYVIVKRKDKSSKAYSFFQIDLEKAFKQESSDQNITLSDNDELLFLPELLSPELITTRLVKDEYVLDEDIDQMVLEDEWTSLAYLKKSLKEQSQMNLQQSMIQDNGLQAVSNDINYYEYSVYDYCTVSDEITNMIQNEGEEFTNEEISIAITASCREQLLAPMIDIIKRENASEKLNIVSLFGNVFFPGEYPYTKNMKLSDAIKAGGGSKNGTYNTEVELTRLSNEGKRFTSSNNIFSIDNKDRISLNKMDIINLKQLSNTIRSVEIMGEVYFPGIYPLSEDETLTNIIHRAGGLTDQADLRAAFFQRQALKDMEEETLRAAQADLNRKILLSSQTTSIGEGSLDNSQIAQLTSLANSQNIQTETLGRLVIDLKGMTEGRVSDIELRDGDSISIPKTQQSISVVGEVFVDNNHIFRDNLNLDDYIALSGGSTDFADESNIYLIKSDGSIISPSQLTSGFFRSDSNRLEPGDTIVVPLEVQPFSNIKAATEITQIIYQMAIAAAAASSF